MRFTRYISIYLFTVNFLVKKINTQAEKGTGLLVGFRNQQKISFQYFINA